MRWKALSFLLLWMIAGRLVAGSGAAERRLDPMLKLLYRAQTETKARELHLERSREILGVFQPSSTRSGALLALLDYSGDPEQLASRGFEVQSRLGIVYTGLLDPDRLSGLLALPGMRFIQLSQRLYRQQGPVTGGGGAPVRGTAASTAPEPSTASLSAGAGVLIGFIDTGVDVRHQDFRKPDGTTRIRFLLDLSDPGDVDEDGILDGPDDFGGTLYTEQQINAALRSSAPFREKDTTGHGTHGLSVAAGDDPLFPGVAPAADLIVVKATRHDGSLAFESLDVLNALSFIDQKAAQLGRPYVVNLSLGSSFGPHDGRTLEELAIDSLVGPGIPGKVVVLAAGNSGDRGGNHFHHFQGTAYAGLETRHVLTVPPYGAAVPGVDNDLALLDLWYEGNDRLTLRVTAPDGLTRIEAPYGEFVDESTPFGQVFIANMGGPSPLNGDVEAVVLLYDKSGTAPAPGDWTISLTGERIEAGGRYHGWLVDGASTVGGHEPYLSGNLSGSADDRFLIGRPGSAVNGITVGSFARHDPASRYRTSWTDVRGIPRVDSTAHAEDLSNFSSTGTTRDGRIKPEIVAPGERVLGAVSRDADPALVASSLFRDHPFPEPDALLLDTAPDHGFGLLQGTSFAAPTVTGLAARILAMAPTLDAVQVRNVLINSARPDAFTGAVPNDAWGFGKADLTLAGDPSRPLPSNLRILSEPLPAGVVGQQYNHVFTATGGTLPYAWSVIDGSLPPGLSLAAGALLTGVPSAAGTWRFTLQAVDSSTPRQTVQRVCEVRVSQTSALDILTSRLPVARINQAYSVTLRGEGGTPPYTWSLIGGSLPPGLTLGADGKILGIVALAQDASFTVRLADQRGNEALQSFTLQVSSSAGDEWRQVGTSLVGASVLIDPNDGKHFVASVSGYISSSSTGRIMESFDGGASWRDIGRNNGLWRGSLAGINPADSTVWARDGSGTYAFYDRANNEWRRWSYCPPPSFAYSETTLLGLGFTRSGDMYALPYNVSCPQQPQLTQYYGFLRSTDRGANWQNIGTFPTSGRHAGGLIGGSFAISAGHPEFMYAGRNDGCHAGCDELPLEEKYYRTQDGGRTWTELPVAIVANTSSAVSASDPMDVFRFSSNPYLSDLYLEKKYMEHSLNGGQAWTNISLPGSPKICRVVRSEVAPAILFAETDKGLFKSTDNGLHWQEVAVKGLNLNLCRGGGVTFDPHDANRIFLGTIDYNLFESTDGGQTWKARGDGLTIKAMNGIAINPAKPADLLALAAFPYVSRSTGERWTLSAAGIDSAAGYLNERYGYPLVSPRDPNLYFFLDNNHSLYRSENAGLKWVKLSPVFAGGLGPLEGHGGETPLFDSIAVDPFDSAILLARVSRYDLGEGRPSGIWRSGDRGTTWTKAAEVSPAPADNGFYHQWEPEIVFDPRTPGRVYALGPAGVYRSDDRGSSWLLLAPLAGGTPWVLDVAPSDSRYLYAIRGQTLSGYDAKAGTWRSVTFSASNRFISLAVDAGDPRTAYVGRWYTYPDQASNESGGIDKTTNAGRTWQRLSGFPKSLSVIGLVAHPTNSGTIFAATKEDGIYRTVDGGVTWQKLDNYGAVADLVNVAVPDPANRFILYVGTQGFGVQVSTDGGKTFLPRVTGLGNLNVKSLAFDAGTPAILYAGTEDGLFKTTDGGETWTSTDFADGLVTDISIDTGTRPRRVRIITLNGVGVSNDEGRTFRFSSAGLSSRDLTSIEAEPRGASTRLWVTTRGGDGVAFSDDQGATWKPAAGNGLTDRNVNDLAVEPGAGHRLWVATDGGVFFSDNAGLSWLPFSTGLPDGVAATSLSIDPNSNEVLVSLFDRDEGGVYRGGNFRGAWSAFNDGLNDFRVRKLTRTEGHALVGTARGTTFYAATSGGGLFTTELETVSTAAPAIATPALPDGALGVAYDTALSATGGVPPYAWSLAAGTLPPGLGLDPASGRLAGTPVRAGLFRFTLQVASAASGAARRDFTLRIHEEPTFLRITKDGSGTGTVSSDPAGIRCGADCSESFPAGTRVALRATPDAGSAFSGWGGACSGTGTCSLTITAVHTVTASFTKAGYSLTLLKAGNGTGTVTSNPQGIACGSDCSEVYGPKTKVTLTAKAAAGSVFSGWSGGGCSGTGACKVTMNAARTVTATFRRKP